MTALFSRFIPAPRFPEIFENFPDFCSLAISAIHALYACSPGNAHLDTMEGVWQMAKATTSGKRKRRITLYVVTPFIDGHQAISGTICWTA
jgi:hypothetical protein